MNQSIFKAAVLGICVLVAIFMASPIQGQEQEEDKVKLTVAEVDDLLLKPGGIVFGINHQTSSVWITETLQNGERNMYWQNIEKPFIWATCVDPHKIIGDQPCAKWTFGPENCFDVYRVGEDKYESWLGGALVATWYKGQRPFETKKDKVKLTGAELQEIESEYFIRAGIDTREEAVWIEVRPIKGKRQLYWKISMYQNVRQGVTGAESGIARVAGGQVCVKYIFWTERCRDIYRVGEDKYESWLDEDFESTFYRLK